MCSHFFSFSLIILSHASTLMHTFSYTGFFTQCFSSTYLSSAYFPLPWATLSGPAERLVSLSLSLPGLTVLLWASEGMSWDKHWISITSIQLQPRNSLMHNCLYIKINPSLDVLRVFCPCALITYYVPDIMHTLSQFSQQPCKNRLLHLTNEKTDSQKSKRHSAHFRFWDNYLRPCQIRLF